jgi:hypothetical protein
VFLACVEAEVERLLGYISKADLESRASPPHAKLAGLARAIVEHGRAHPASARLLHLTARHRASRVAGDVDAALARLPAWLATTLRSDTTPRCADRLAPALLGAAAALALDGTNDPKRDSAMLGDAFAAVLEPVDEAAAARVRSVGLY